MHNSGFDCTTDLNVFNTHKLQVQQLNDLHKAAKAAEIDFMQKSAEFRKAVYYMIAVKGMKPDAVAEHLPIGAERIRQIYRQVRKEVKS